MITNILKKLLAFRPLTTDSAACQQLLTWISQRPECKDLHATWFEEAGVTSLLLTTKVTKTPKIWLVAHIDVVEAEDDQFELKEEGDRLIGRGTNDMLFAVAAYLELLRELGPRVKDLDFGLMLTSDEERGGRLGVGALLEAGYRGDCAVVPDGGNGWQLIAAAKGVLQVKMEIHGKAAHSSKPWQGKNPIVPLLERLQRVTSQFTEQFGEGPGSLATCTVTKLEAGKELNRIPDKATAYLDIRYRDSQDMAAIRKLLGPVEEIACANPINVDAENPYLVSFRKKAAAAGVQIPIGESSGSNDGRYFSAQGIPVIIFRPDGGGHHGPDEWVSHSGVQTMVSILKQFLV